MILFHRKGMVIVMKKRREDSFFGVHFDFHAMEGQTVPEIFRPDVVAEMLDRVRPDFVQCDTKGHPGLSSYPTKAGTQAYAIQKDVLKMWRDLTEERGIALYGHHSGLFDMTVAKNHPDWAVMDENGNVSTEAVSPFSPYADEVLIPQLLELALDYKLDGAWIDGECWCARVDYSPYAKAAYFRETGKEPPVRGDADYEAYREFCRKGFLAYVRHYIAEVKKAAPMFQITSNWLFSSYMPEKPSVNVDFLSGDYDPVNSVISARTNGRCSACYGMPWELISWGQNAIPFSWETHNRNTKELAQYCQEAAEIISLGGAYMFFNIMYGNGGYIQEWAIPVWEKVAAFVRERQTVCFHAKPLSELAVLYPLERTSLDTDALYSTRYESFASVRAWINALQNTQRSCVVLPEYQAQEGALDQVRLLVVPNTGRLEPATIQRIAAYVKEGGSVLLDQKACRYFMPYTGLEDAQAETRLVFLDGGDALAALEVETAPYTAENAAVTGAYYDRNFYDGNPHPAALCTPYGKGRFINLCFSFSTGYASNVSSAIEAFLNRQLAELNFAPTVQVENSPLVDMAVCRKDGKLLVNLINCGGSHALPYVRSYNYIPPLYNIGLKIHTEEAPQALYLEPGHTPLPFTYENKTVSVTVKELAIHSVVVME